MASRRSAPFGGRVEGIRRPPSHCPPLLRAALSEIRAIVVQYHNMELGAARAYTQIKHVLVSTGHARKRRIPPMLVCPHRLNYGGLIANVMAVDELMEHIAAVGFCLPETERALCVEVVSQDTSDEDRYREWCLAAGLAAGIDMPRVASGSIKYASLDGSHLNLGLRAISSGCTSRSTALGNGSNYDVDVVRNHDCHFAEAVSKGLVWTVIQHDVLEMYPELAEILMTFGNIYMPPLRPVGLREHQPVREDLYTITQATAGYDATA